MRAYLALILAMIMIGGNIPLGKLITETIPPTSFAILRFISSTLVLIPLAMMEPGALQSLSRLNVRQWLEITCLSLFGAVLFTTFMLVGVQYTPAINAGIISSSLPAVIAVLSFLILREYISARTAGSITLAVLGIAILNLSDPSGHESSATTTSGQSAIWFGNSLIFAAICSEALFAVLSRRYAAIIPVWTLSLLVHALAIPLTIPLLVMMDGGLQVPSASLSFWGIAGYYILSASLLSFYLWCYGIRSVPASTAGVFTALVPVTSLLIAILALGETLSWLQVAGLSFIFLSLWLGLSSRRRPATSSNPSVQER
jgi:drug/metabolite transporter (DMT)-like permease